MKPHKLHLALFILGLSAPAHAAISLNDTGAHVTYADQTSYTITAANVGGTLNLTGASKLVVTIGTETAANGAGTAPTSVTYGGVALTSAISQVGANGRASIYYLDLGTASFTGTDFFVDFGTTAQSGIGFGAYVLGGTASGVASTANSGGNTTVDVTTAIAGEFVITSFARNNIDFVQGTSGPVGAQAPLTELYRSSILVPDGTAGWSAASAYATLASAGTQTLTFYENNSTGRIVAASFAPVPEPSAALLGGVGLLALLRRRRA